jgi:hypothetical protein
MVEGEQRGTVWPEDVPEDMVTGSGEATAPPITPVVDDPPAKQRGAHLKLVE